MNTCVQSYTFARPHPQQESCSFVPLFKDTADNWAKLSRHVSNSSLMEQYSEKLDYSQLSANPHAVGFLEKHHPHLINWTFMSLNHKAIHLLAQNTEKIDWDRLSANKRALSLLQQFPEKINWTIFCAVAAKENMKFIEENLDKVDWESLSGNSEAMQILLKNREKIHWDVLSHNKSAARFLLHNPCRIHWDNLSENTSNSTSLLTLFGENIEKLNFARLSSNPSNRAIDILFQHPEKIVWQRFCCNTNPRALAKLKEILSKQSAFFEPVDIPNCPIVMTRGLHLRVYWNELSSNPAALSLLQTFSHEIVFSNLLCNPNPLAYLLAFKNTIHIVNDIEPKKTKY